MAELREPLSDEPRPLSESDRERPTETIVPAGPRPTDWTPPVTAVVRTAGALEVVVGAVHKGRFRAREWARQPADSAPARIVGHSIALAPSALISSRYLTLPATDIEAISSMVPHQLSATLPVDLEAVSWSVTPVLAHDDGSTTVLVHLVRKDQLETALEALPGNVADWWAVVPEAHVLARTLRQRCPSDRKERFVVTWFDDEFHVVLERSGELLYHRSFPARQATQGEEPSRAAAEMTLLARAEIQSARKELDRLFGSGIADSIEVVGDLGLAGRSEELEHEFARRLSEALDTEVLVARVVDPTELEEADRAAPIAANLARLGASRVHSVLPQDAERSTDRKALQSGLLKSGLLVLGFVAVVIAILVVSLTRREEQIALLESRVAEAASSANELEQMRAELDAWELSSSGELELLHVLSAVEGALERGIHIQQVSYSKGSRLQVSGTAPELRLVNDFAIRLKDEPWFRDVDVKRIQRPGRNPSAHFQFELDARLANGGTP